MRFSSKKKSQRQVSVEKIAVVLPSYKVCNHVLNVIAQIGPEVHRIYVIDDHCPDHSGLFVQTHCLDQRIVVIYHSENQGVGGAVMTGYQAALQDGMDIIVKIDADEQMDPNLILNFISPIIHGHADYAKGNRFFNLDQIRVMPKLS